MRRWIATTALALAAVAAVLLVPPLRRAPPPDPGPDALLPAGPVDLDLAIDRRVLLRHGNEPRYVVATVRAPDAPDGPRAPLHLALVFDTSGSMREDGKLDAARHAAQALAARLGEGDSLALVTFDDRARVRIAGGSPVRARTLADALAAIEPYGGTNLHAGLEQGLEQLAMVSGPGIRRVVLLSDGIANVGEIDPGALERLAATGSASGISVSALGVGVEFDEDLLAAVSDAGGGRYRFVPEAAGLDRAFLDAFEQSARVVARNALLRLWPAEDVQVEEVYGVPWTGGASVALYLGDLHAGERRKLVLRVRIPDGRPGPVAVARAELTSTTLGEGGATSTRATLEAMVSEDAGEVRTAADPAAGGAAARAILGAALDRSARAWAAGAVEEARNALEEAVRAVEGDALRWGIDLEEAGIPEVRARMHALGGAGEPSPARPESVKEAKERARAWATWDER